MIIVNNIIKIDSTTNVIYPKWSDYGCLVKAYDIWTYENNEFKRQLINKEEEYGDYLQETEIELNFHPDKIKLEKDLKDYLLNERIKKSKEQQNSYNAKIGDIIEVFKGTKYPIGKRFEIVNEYTWKDKFGHVTHYWITSTNERVDKRNTILVGRKENE